MNIKVGDIVKFNYEASSEVFASTLSLIDDGVLRNKFKVIEAVSSGELRITIEEVNPILGIPYKLDLIDAEFFDLVDDPAEDNDSIEEEESTEISVTPMDLASKGKNLFTNDEMLTKRIRADLTYIAELISSTNDCSLEESLTQLSDFINKELINS